MKKIALIFLLSSSAIAAQSPADKRAAFLKLVDAPRVDPAVAVRPMTATAPGLVQEHISLSVEAAQRVTGLVVKPEGSTGRLPVVVQLHGTGGTKEQLLPRLNTLAGRGFLAVAIDGRYHGERAGTAAVLDTPYTSAILHAYKTRREHPFFYDTVLDVMRLIDYLETRPDVDPTRIGLGGGSKGGIETYLTAAVDTRVAASVSERGVQSFKWGLDHGGWDSRAWTFRDALEAAADESKSSVNASFVRQFYDRVAPGIYGEFDAPAMLPLVAPRAMLVINGDSDPRTPMAGVRESAAAAERAYKAAGASEKFVLRVMPNHGHENTPEIDQAMVEWFVKWLKPSR
jgi:acetyl esterase/lipase